MEGDWVDFRVIKAAVTIEMVLQRYRIALKRSGQELRGKCPIHRGASNKHFTANLSKNVFKCFFAECGAHGNVLDFVAAMEHCSVREAAVKLRDWFKVGESTLQSKDDGSAEEIKIKAGIYRDTDGAVYEVIGIASHSDSSESWVVYRELFGEYRLLVMSAKSFRARLEPLSRHPLTLVKTF
jgi:hypothetical protein